MEEYFRKYVSNTAASTANQTYFAMAHNEETARAFIKVTVPGKFDYSLLFCNALDSTFGTAAGWASMLLPDWEICGMKAGTVPSSVRPQEAEPSNFVPLTFGGKTHKKVNAGELFYTDPASIDVGKDDYLVVEISYRGTLIPCLKEAMIPTFVKRDRWVASPLVPLPAMVGCAREVKRRIAFWGDSITQGIGVAFDSYLGYAQRTACALGSDYACWDLGIGCARAADAATGGVWAYKASRADIVTVCFGVNDYNARFSAAETVRNLRLIVTRLKSAGKKVLLHTVPPYRFEGEAEKFRREVNESVLGKLGALADMTLDLGFLGSAAAPGVGRFNPHPNEEGCALWADALVPAIRALAK